MHFHAGYVQHFLSFPPVVPWKCSLISLLYLSCITMSVACAQVDSFSGVDVLRPDAQTLRVTTVRGCPPTVRGPRFLPPVAAGLSLLPTTNCGRPTLAAKPEFYLYKLSELASSIEEMPRPSSYPGHYHRRTPDDRGWGPGRALSRRPPPGGAPRRTIDVVHTVSSTIGQLIGILGRPASEIRPTSRSWRHKVAVRK